MNKQMNFRSPDNTQPTTFKSLKDTLKESAPNMDSREVEKILAIIEFISTLDLSKNSQVAIIGPGNPSDFFWPGLEFKSKEYMIHNSNLTQALDSWERIIFDTGANLNIFEPSLRVSTEWSRISAQLKRGGYSGGQIKINYGESAYFQNSDLADNSIDLIVFMNLFGTPTLIADDEESNAIVRKIGSVLKNGGVIICGDTWERDREISQKRLIGLKTKDQSLIEIRNSGKVNTPWLAYRLIRSELQESKS